MGALSRVGNLARQQPFSQVVQLQVCHSTGLFGRLHVLRQKHETVQNHVADCPLRFGFAEAGTGRFPCGGDQAVDDFIETWIFAIARMVINETGSSFGIQQQCHGHIGSSFHGRHGIESNLRAGVEIFARGFVLGRVRRKKFQDSLRDGKGGGIEGFQDRIEGTALFGGRHYFRDGFAVTPNRVGVVQASDYFRCGFELIAVK